MEVAPSLFEHAVLVVGHILVFMFCLAMLIVLAVWVDEKLLWNNGVCRRTGNPWKFIKRDPVTDTWVWYGGEGIYQAFLFRMR